MTDDVEKRFDRPGAFRAAVTYGAVVIAIAAGAFALYAFIDRDSVIGASTVPAILLVGGIGAFVRTYHLWKAEDSGWVAWQGAGWFLLLLMLVCLSVPGAAMMAS
ncbi:hypothetical protein [Mycolicibacterium holsaticum]|jgi:hypothetical protein|uniref:Transmembrane protein n=1 Tax=Mycolicibacterium holsaticum TaxID=152142 RepID=A0A1E3RSR4_9MYCO|nr:hypothetical protein [Mycolicibacterium holsaticum]MDA4110778.1 membrane protein [Mycolicibacterium holsaticum DSM 44478 = JCM 12374]ODQ92935.1 hypothetical protein BHQ17_15325 [Mycolicibacterium holsaticum]QZA12264.1 hypothetical protein K3U96_24560 [Mycolicibacterium holsaticum DSM 44478 = JCM 12374]UNC10250.1 hypothetical protein H5U41_02240 [Mycolicibacterium holsaticum DSM 44478 = JCM 12374]